MKAPTQHPAIAKINEKIEAFHGLERDFQNDQTLKLAESALETAKATAAEAELEDDSIDPEELVDRLIEARRKVEIAEIRLARAKKAVESQKWRVMNPICDGGLIAAEALREVVEPFKSALESESRRIFGDDCYESEAAFFKSIIYRKCERFHGLARQLEKVSSIQALDLAVAMINEAASLG